MSGDPQPIARLPVQHTSFVGRDTELASLASLLGTFRLVTITGPAGMGKTRLAVEVAGRLPVEGPDGVWFASLAALGDGALVAQEVATGLGVREKPGEPVVETLAAHVGARRMLLLIDNCEHLVDAGARLVEALLRGCDNLRVLATSREPLRVPGERVWRIPPLRLPDVPDDGAFEAVAGSEAARLFEARAGMVRSQFRIGRSNAPAVALICRRLDGIPLAIELAAARIETMPVEDVLARLEDRFKLLAAGGTATVARHQTLHAALDWDHQLLDDRERRLFRRISTFSGGFDLAAAQAVCAGPGLEADAVDDLIFRLVEKSLLVPDLNRPDQTRYGLLETVRQYAAERLVESGEPGALGRRHVVHYLGLAEAAEGAQRGTRQPRWLERLESEHDNFRAALGWCRVHDAACGLRLGASLAWFWVTRGYFTEGREWLGSALATTTGDARAQARGLLEMARLSFWQGAYAPAQALCEQSLALYRDLAGDVGCGSALTLLGLVHAYQGHFDEGRARLEEVLATVRDDDVRLEALIALGEALLQAGEFDQARARLEEVLAPNRGPEAPRGRAALFLGLVALLHDGDCPRARQRIAQGLEIFHALGNRYAAAGAFDAAAALAMMDSEPLRALRLSGAAAALRESLRARLAPRWQDLVRSTVVEPASAAAADLGPAAWAAGERMTFDEATGYALEGLRGEPAPEASPAAPAPTRRPGGLSRRELEVAELVAANMTNHQIAERLVIAERTVEGHVERVRNKLGVHSRTQIAISIIRERAWPSR